jgi:hypothetical protein
VTEEQLCAAERALAAIAERVARSEKRPPPPRPLTPEALVARAKAALHKTWSKRDAHHTKLCEKRNQLAHGVWFRRSETGDFALQVVTGECKSKA